MTKYRKKPVVIEAVQLPSDPAWAGNEVVAFFANTVGSNVRVYDDGSVSIHTLEGVMRANPGDYIIRGVKGEVYPCKPDIFEATYERVE